LLKKHAIYIFLKHINKKATRNIFRMAFFRIITNYDGAVVGCYLSDVVFNNHTINKIRMIIKTIQPSSHPTVKPSNHRAIQQLNRPTIKPSNRQTIQQSNHQTIKPVSPKSQIRYCDPSAMEMCVRAKQSLPLQIKHEIALRHPTGLPAVFAMTHLFGFQENLTANPSPSESGQAIQPSNSLTIQPSNSLTIKPSTIYASSSSFFYS
jgi:hypothetical protein